MPRASLTMRLDAVPPEAIGLLVGILTTAVAVGIGATGLLPAWLATPLLFAGGLAAGLAAPVRPTTGALLGGAVGVVAAVLLTIVLSIQWHPDPEMFFSPFPFALIAVASVLMYAPLYAVAGAVGAAVRPRLVGPRPTPAARARPAAPERRQWAGIVTGALCILSASWASTLAAPATLPAVFLASALVGGFVAGILSPGGARAGAGAGLLVGIFGLGVLALYFIRQASMATGDGVPEGLWPIAVGLVALWVLPAVVIAGALGGSFRRPAGALPEPEL